MSHASFHAVSIKTGHDPAGTLSAALATATRVLQQQFREAETKLDDFRLGAISHAHTLMATPDGLTRVVVTAIAGYEYT